MIKLLFKMDESGEVTTSAGETKIPQSLDELTDDSKQKAEEFKEKANSYFKSRLIHLWMSHFIGQAKSSLINSQEIFRIHIWMNCNFFRDVYSTDRHNTTCVG